MDGEAESGDGRARARQGLTVIGAAVLVLVTAGVIYLRPVLLQPSGSPSSTALVAAPRSSVVSMSWQSSKLGWLTMADHVGSGHSWLFRTSDGGQHWQVLRKQAGAVMQVRFFDARQGQLSIWPEGDGGRPEQNVLLSGDGGSSWRAAPLPGAASMSRQPVEFLDLEHGWAALGRSPGSLPTQLYLTADGGRHWEGPRDLPAPGQVWFADAEDGWLSAQGAAGAPVLFGTRDAGQHWQQLSLVPPANGWRTDKVYFVESPAVLPSGLGALLVDAEPADSGSSGPTKWLYLTRDGGRSWSGPTSPPGASSSLHSGPFLTEEAGWWVTEGASAWFSADHGLTWTASAGVLPRGWEFASIVPIGASTAWAQAVDLRVPGTLSPPWGLFRTSDRGRHWVRVQQPRVGSQP